MVFWIDTTLLVGINAEIIVNVWVILTVQAKVVFAKGWQMEKVNVRARIVHIMIRAVCYGIRPLKIFVAMWLCK